MNRWLKQWEVASLTEPGKFYTVSMDRDRKLACSCPAWKFQKKINGAERKPCKHCAFVLGQLEAAKRGVAMAAIESGITVTNIRAQQLERALEKALERLNSHENFQWTVASWLDRLDNVAEPVVKRVVPRAPEEFVIKRVISFDE